MAIDPNSVKWDASPQLDESQIKWDDAPTTSSKGPAVPFKSGSAFHDTKELVPDLKGLWEQFKKEWENRTNTPMTPEIAAKMMQDEHAAGSAVLDTVGALPAMLAGGVHGVYDAVKNKDATQGLKTAGETMGKLLPSTLLGNEADQQMSGYKAGMAPVTALMDTLNAIPQGYGEIINATGHPDAAAQVTDAGKLGVMVAGAGLGAHELVKGRSGAEAAKHADKLELKDEVVDPSKVKWDKDIPAQDRGIPGQVLGEQGQLWSQEHDTPTQPISAESQGDLFGGMPAKFGEHTQAHADDFATINPYDMGGHVTEAMEGRPASIDNPQGELFGGKPLEPVQPGPRVPDDTSVANATLPTPPNSWEQGPLGSRDVARAKREQVAREEEFRAQQEAEHKATREAAYKAMEDLANSTKARDYTKMEAQKELDFADATNRIENSVGRKFFLDPLNREQVMRPGEVSPMTLYHGTTPEAKAAIKESGKFDPNAGTRHYSYSEFGPDAVYLTQEGGWWLDHEKAENGRAAKYDAVVKAQLDPSANIRHIKNQSDLRKLAKELGFEHEHEMMNHFFVDGLDDTRPEVRQQIDAHYEPMRQKLKEAGIDAIIIDKKYRDKSFSDPASNQVAVFNHGKLVVDKDYHFSHNVLEDASLMSPEHTQVMVDALRRNDVHGVLDAIAKNHENVTYRNLAEFLKGQLDNFKIKMHDEGILEIGDKHATGYYDPTTRTVGLSRVGATSPHTVLHELVHALTSDFVNARPNDLRVVGLKDLFNKLNEMGMAKEFPEIINVKEFLAEAFSNPEFQDFLKEHKLQNRSTWRRFVDNVKSMLGFSSATRNHITDALEHVMDLGKQIAEAGKDDVKGELKDAGMPDKLADLMVVRKQRPKASTSPEVSKLKIPALKDAISDFKFDDRPMNEIIEEARTAPDIPNNALEKLSHQLQAGGLFESLKTRNPVVKATYERITRASQEYAREVKQYLTDPKEGLKAYMRALSPDEKGEIHSFMMLNEGQREFSVQELRQQGFNEKQVQYYQKAREQDKRFFDQMNQRRAELGMEPIDHRVAHMAGRFMGDFSRFVFDETGKKIVGRIAGNTRWELERASKFIQEQHPEWKMGDHEYNRLGGGKNPADRFQGLMEALNFITKTNADASALMDSYKAYIQKDAIGYLNAVRHAKAKVKEAGGIIGSEGNKPWLDTVKNAEEGMKAQLAYFEQGYKWMAMEKAVHDLKPLLGDKEVALNQKNALKWSQAYVNHALGKQGVLADAVNWTASVMGEYTGLGHTNFFKLNNKVKHVMMQKFMGLMNIPFSITQMMQPFQVHPPMMALLKNRGLEFSATEAQIKATRTYLNALSGEKTGAHSAFEKAALDYAEKAGIMDVKMADHTKDINESPLFEAYSKIADLNIEVPEKLTRGTSFLFYSHILKDAGVPMKDIFGAAENLTNMTMVNYHPIERPMGYAQLGWLGDLASTLTRYKHNQLSQAAFYTREGINSGNMKGYKPLATFLATSLAFGGVMGFFGYNEADWAYQKASQFFGKPDTLTNVLFSHNTPELITHGIFSTIGLDMTSRFSNANILPDSAGQALMPYGSAVLDMLGSTANLVTDPLSTTRWKQFGKSMAPQSVQGFLENQMFMEKQPDGRNLYINNTDGPNFGKGRVYRSDSDMAMRNFGFRDITESKKLAKNYSDTQINKGNSALAQGILDKVKLDFMDGNLTPEKLQAYGNKAATQYGMDPGTFVNELVKWQQEHHMSQEEQIRFRNALGGFTGAMRAKEGR